jgi:hypothetical protein
VCVSFHLQGKDRIHYLFVSLLNCSGFFRLCKECTTEYWKLCSQCKECASELFRVREERAQEGTPEKLQLKRLLNTLEESLYAGVSVAQSC